MLMIGGLGFARHDEDPHHGLRPHHVHAHAYVNRYGADQKDYGAASAEKRHVAVTVGGGDDVVEAGPALGVRATNGAAEAPKSAPAPAAPAEAPTAPVAQEGAPAEPAPA